MFFLSLNRLVLVSHIIAFTSVSGPVHMYPFLLENGDFFFLRFNEIRVHTLCSWIFFALPLENAIVTENGTIFERRAFSKRCVFRDRFHRIRVNGRLNRRKNLRSQTKTDMWGRCAVPHKVKEPWNGYYSPEQTWTCPSYFYLARRMNVLSSFSEMEWIRGKICRERRGVYRS